MGRHGGIGVLLFDLIGVLAVCGVLAGDQFTREIPEPQTTEAQYTLVAVGDIQLGRRVGQRIREQGWGYLFETAKPLTDSADIVFANLECPAALSGSPYPGKDPDVTFRADPTALFSLKKAAFSVVSLANNHSTDYGSAALQETLEALRLLDISTCGAGTSEDEAHAPAIKTLGLWSVAILAYAENLWSVTEAQGAPSGGTAGVAVIDEDRMVRDIQKAKERADLVVLSLHWGEEHQGVPTEAQRDLAHRLVREGAGLIVGHHPHVLQGVEFFQGVPILYSLGNFVFDMISPRTYDSALARISLRFSETTIEGKVHRSVKIPRLELVPILIDRQTYAPRVAEGKDRERILELLGNRCAVLGKRSVVTDRGTLVISADAPGEPET